MLQPPVYQALDNLIRAIHEIHSDGGPPFLAQSTTAAEYLPQIRRAHVLVNDIAEKIERLRAAKERTRDLKARYDYMMKKHWSFSKGGAEKWDQSCQNPLHEGFPDKTVGAMFSGLLSTRTITIFEREEIIGMKLMDFMSRFSESWLLMKHGFGRKSLNEVKDAIHINRLGYCRRCAHPVMEPSL